ncbi:hypothetical protein Dsui_0202 [Azospira oryzae PS]|uniref:Uncharacterized protein n=1 Tax=Azospira oryzae (strain ATCC BAA-33 / DSM 13638 / PS) TaxID=640081 RepID=G8QMP2_AZOOP|nr:hypothetical protein [Azospira oryzae]AEV24622.1 hypothetical protein Dsui_0202 [Azospira oryzae PS]
MAIVKVKGIPVDLGGETFVIPPLALGALEQLQERVAKFKGDIRDAEQVATVIDAAHAALKRNYPDMPRETVADLIDVGNMAEVFEAVMDVSGLKRKALEAAQGEAPEPGK